MASSSSAAAFPLRRRSAPFRRLLFLLLLISAAAIPLISASYLPSSAADGGDNPISHGASAGGGSSSTARNSSGHGGSSARREIRKEEAEEEGGENDRNGLDLAGRRRRNVAAVEIGGGGGMKALYETIPAAPVEGQAKSCALDLSDELLGGVRAACMKGKHVERRRCCPVLAAWLMAARSRTALHPPLLQSAAPPLDGGGATTTLPLLPDDSLVCIASLKSALAARGIHLNPPNASCDVVTCVCGIRLNHLSAQSCPLPFFWRRHAKGVAGGGGGHRNVTSEEEAAITVDFPLQPSAEGIPPPPPAGLSELLQALATNCTDHSYRGCTRCLRTLRKEVSNKAARDEGIVAANSSSGKALNCELIGLMWLLEVNKTFYIPTVSAVVRALMYGDHPSSSSSSSTKYSPTCSPDTENMPLALDYSEILSAAVAPSTSAASPPIFPAAAAALFLLHLFSSSIPPPPLAPLPRLIN